MCSLDRFLKMRRAEGAACQKFKPSPLFPFHSFPFSSSFPSPSSSSVFEFSAFLGGVETRQSLLWTLQAGTHIDFLPSTPKQNTHACSMRYRTPPRALPHMWRHVPYFSHCKKKSTPFPDTQVSLLRIKAVSLLAYKQLTRRAMSNVCEMHPRNATPPFLPQS